MIEERGATSCPVIQTQAVCQGDAHPVRIPMSINSCAGCIICHTPVGCSFSLGAERQALKDSVKTETCFTGFSVPVSETRRARRALVVDCGCVCLFCEKLG